MWAVALAICLVCTIFVSAQESRKVHLLFCNGSAKFVNFYVDGQFICAVSQTQKRNVQLGGTITF